MAATLNIGGSSYTMIEDQFDLTLTLDERQRFRCDFIDSGGTVHLQKDEQVTVSDPVLGTIFTGYLYTDKETPLYPSGAIQHSIDCIDDRRVADKRTYTRNYTTPQPAGKIAIDQISSTLLAEGITQNFAERYETTAADFGTGTLTNVVGVSNVDDGDLELVKAGSAVTITENTTANFATGTLTGVTASNNTLTPTTVNALQLQSTLTAPLTSNSIYMKFWQGAMTVGTSDTLHYDIWIASSSPQQTIAVDLTFSDGTLLRNVAGIVDQNSQSAAPTTDLGNYAKNQWYSRSIALTGLNGKVITAVTIGNAGNSAGTYTAYVKNCYLQSQSGSPFFGTATTAPNVNPPLAASVSGYLSQLTAVTVASVWDPASANRVSSSYSIDAVKLLSSSVVTWIAATPTGTTFSLSASYDGGITYAACSNNAALPALPAGSNVASTTVTLKEVFGTTNPAAIPSLSSVSITLQSAPNATKSDIVQAYASAGAWNGGTYGTGIALASDNVGVTCANPYVRDWSDLSTSGQTLFSVFTDVTDSAASGAYVITVPFHSGTPVPFGHSRLDFLGQFTNFTLDVDFQFNSQSPEPGIMYRTTSWVNTNNTYGYVFGFNTTTGVNFGYGSNSTNDSFTLLASASASFSVNTNYHATIVVSGNSHQLYLNHSGSPILSVTDSTYPNAGYAGFRLYPSPSSSSTMTITWDNLSVNINSGGGTWTSPSVSLSSLGTCGTSAIAWTETNTANSGGISSSTALIQTSVDGGSTFQTCTNGGAVPNLPSGTNVSSKSVLTKVIVSAVPGSIAPPEVSRLFWRVLGAYPTVTGTRSTSPLGIDNMVRANQSGWGTAFDTQVWTKTGTGTDAIASNTGTIANTTGNVFEVLGSNTATDQEATVQIQLSASTIQGGIALRYVSSTKYYKLALSTTGLSIVKNTGSGESTLATTAGTYATGTWYWLRFRVVGSGPVSLYGKAWLGDGSTVEPGVSNGIMSSTSPQWTVLATD